MCAILQAKDPKVAFDLPSGEANEILKTFARQAGVSVVYDPKAVSGVSTNEVIGKMAPRNALERMLSGKHLTFREDAATGAFAVTRDRRTKAKLKENSNKTKHPMKMKPDMKSPNRKKESIRRSASMGLIAALSATVAVTANAQEEESEGEIKELSPFTVSDEAVQGYTTTHTIGATRAAIPLKELPKSVTIINEEFFNDVAAGEAHNALRYVSSYSQSSNNQSMTIRGFGAASVFTDGLPDEQNQTQAGPEPFLYESYEVFKGPSAIVYGSTAPGGVVNKNRKKANLDLPNRKMVGIQIGNHDQYQAHVDFEDRINEDFGYRLVAVYRDEDLIRGRDDKFAFTERFNINPSTHWKITDNVSFQLTGEYMEEDTFKNWANIVGVRPFSEGVTTFDLGLLPRDFVIADSTGKNNNEKYGGIGALEIEVNNNYNIRFNASYFRWDHQVNDWVPNGLLEDNRTMPRRHRLSIDDDIGTVLSIDQSINFNLGPTEHNAIFLMQYERTNNATIFIQDENLFNIDIFEPDHFQGEIGPDGIPIIENPFTLRDNRQKANSWSVSIQDNIRMFDGRFRIVGGVRYDTFDTQTQNLLNDEIEPENRGDDFTFKAGPMFEVFDGLDVYFNWAQTFTPNFTTQPDGTPLKNQEGIIKELGLKLTLFGGRLNGNIAIFDLEETNLTQLDPDPIRASEGYRVQTALNEVKGIDFDITAQLIENWDLLLSGSALDIDSDNGRIGRGIHSESAAFFTRYKFTEGAFSGLTIGGGLNYQGSKPMDSGNTVFADSTAIGDVFARYSWRNYTFSLNVSNVTDKWFMEHGVTRNIIFAGPRRLIKFKVNYDF